ncbi:MAG TPA: PSD1 and planctomycete cytochrome C domain-containing protein [Pirellulales bacterium]|nr:PSD1 and planctomycete cytochrome C domain-containing protein [Pirellulales bacterium]
MPLAILFVAMTAARTAFSEEPLTDVAATATAADLEFFEKQVRPLLVARCHECHAGEKAKGNLHLDSRAAAFAGGDTGPAIAPGKPDESLLIDAVRYGETYQMPPKGKLPDEEIATLVEWVKRGAPWPAEKPAASGATSGPAPFNFAERARHWCFQPLQAAQVPTVANSSWPRTDVDRFILAALEARKLTPAPPAEKPVWLRRVTFDLLGLPPTVAEIEDFLNDDSPQAYEKVVDRLLASPHYGERQARHWLDLARFAETYGHEHDYEIPNAWPYRDYLIRAFNANIPYDKFLIEQVAGDLIDPPRRHPTEGFNESLIGTAFFYLGEARHSPVDVREDEATRIDNQIDVFAKTFLALTVSCARCHDHKFDAITQKDYYALAGYLQSSRYQQAFLDDPSRLQPLLDEFSQLRNRERAAVADFVKSAREPAIARIMAELNKGATPADAASKLLADAARAPAHVLHPLAALNVPPASTADANFVARRAELSAALDKRLAEKRVLQSSPLADFNRPTFGDWIATGPAFGTRPARPGDVAPRAAASGAMTLQLVGSPTAHSGLVADKLPGVLRSPTFTIEKPRLYYHLWGTAGKVRLILDGFQLIQNPIYGGLEFASGGPAPHWHEQIVEKWVGHRAYIELVDDGDGWLALDQVVQAEYPPAAEQANALVAALLNNAAIQSPADLAASYRRLFDTAIDDWLARADIDAETRDHEGDRAAIVNALLSIAAADHDDANLARAGEQARAAFAEIDRRRQQLVARLPAFRRSLAIAEGTPEDESVFIRGNHKTLGERVPRRSLQILGGGEHPAAADSSGRLELARSLVDGSNSLVPRVIVNRVWQRHFGRGLVPTPDDFGVMGQTPSHPELLDWLAAEFMRQGWSLKALDRMLVLSSAYRMSGQTAPAARAADPENRLWHHMPRRRLEAECIRDSVLAVSGRLDRTMFGPGVPPHLTPFMSGRGRPKESGPLDGAGRRSIYLQVRRNFLSPLLLAFDYPTPFTTIGRRTVSNVPAQALVMLNSPFVAEQAELWAKRLLSEAGQNDGDRMQQMYLEAFGRRATTEELAAMTAFLNEQQTLYTTTDAQRPWVDLAHVLFNAKEFVFVE